MAIVKSNKLIETSYQLGSREQFFILFLISKIDSIGDTTLSEFKIHYQEIARILNFDGRKRVANSSDVFKLMDNLNSKSIRFEDDTIEGKEVWITGMQRDKKTNVYTFRINENLKPYLLQLKQHFTKYNIQNVVHLNSHAIRMYEILKRYEYEKNGVTLDVETQLKRWLGIENKYKQYYEFKRWVLLDSQKQLKKYTDIAFEFEPAKKSGKRVIALKFTIFENTPTGFPKSLETLNSVPIENGRKSKTFLKIGDNIVGEKALPHHEKVAHLTWPQKQAYDFLAEREVNKAFIIEKILNHVKVKYQPLQGFEDMYIRVVWTFFKNKTTSKNLAPVFVTWWKKGRLTEENLHAKNVEDVINLKSRLSEGERHNRIIAKTMTFEAYHQYLSEQESSSAGINNDFLENISKKVGSPFSNSETNANSQRRSFDFEAFKKEHPEVYREFYESVLDAYKNHAGQTFDINKFQKSIIDHTEKKCEQWLKEQL